MERLNSGAISGVLERFGRDAALSRVSEGFVALHDLRRQASVPGSIEELEERFVALHDLWRRSPGCGVWPFAGDGPWHLIRREVGDIKGDYSETLIETDSGKVLQVRKVDSRPPRSALDAAEVDERDLVTRWMDSIADVQIRRAVWVVTEALARGDCGPLGRVPWRSVAAWVRWRRTPAALKLRYRLALAEVVCGLNGWPKRKARVLAVARR